MKKLGISLGIVIVVVAGCIAFLWQQRENNDLKKVTVAEVTHSIFYTPWYVAIEKGFFADEGIEIDLVLTSGADKVSAALLSNDADIGFAGPESSIYVFNGGEEDYIRSFAALTKRDGQFIVARKKTDNFSLDDLYGKEVLAGRVGGMPILNFQNALANYDIDESKIEINTSVEFAALAGSFAAGIGDYVNLFEPNASALEASGAGYVVASIGKLSGEVPYTAFNARKSYIENNPEVIKGFVRALNAGIDYTFTHSDLELAEIIAPQFPDLKKEEIAVIIKRYRDADSWYKDTTIKEEAFENLEDIMIKANLLEEYVPFDKLVIKIDE